jgi:chromosome segregation ATPase
MIMSTINVEKCPDQHRVVALEKTADSIKDDVKELHAGLTALTNEIHKIGISINSHTEMINNFMIRMNERDRVIESYRSEHKESLTRIGAKLDAYEERLRLSESVKAQLCVHDSRISVLEKLTWTVAMGVGGLILFYVQQRMT